MRRNNLFKTIIIVLAAAWSLVILFPTIQLNQHQKKAEQYYDKIEQNTTLSRNDIKAALAAGNLELSVRDRFQANDGESLEDIVATVVSLQEIDKKIIQNEPNSIKLGLDLQGGTYLVYELNMPQLLLKLSKEVDPEFEKALLETDQRADDENQDFLNLLTEVFEKNELALNRYFGRRSDSDSDIINSLQEEADDAVERTLEVLRNRIDQFGVSEPSITKQGSGRIVIELAGIQDVDRAKNIIGTTALLEFQLEAEPDVVRGIFNEINRVMKKDLSVGGVDSLASTASDTARDDNKVRRDSEVSLEDVFGESSILEERADSGSPDADSTVLLDEDVFKSGHSTPCWQMCRAISVFRRKM